LLHGVTGSGKTEIYLRLIAEVLELGETALFWCLKSVSPRCSAALPSHTFPTRWHCCIAECRTAKDWTSGTPA
jgi:hypothetical protein